MIRRVAFLPAAERDFGRLDRITQERIASVLERYAESGHGDVKRLKGRAGQHRLRVGKWRVFLVLNSPDLVLVIGIDNRGKAY
jgi:mRNA interferase RelE/StbE